MLRKAFERRDRGAIELADREKAPARGLAVNEDRASTAIACVAAHFRGGEAEFFAEDAREALDGRGAHRDVPTIYGQRDGRRDLGHERRLRYRNPVRGCMSRRGGAVLHGDKRPWRERHQSVKEFPAAAAATRMRPGSSGLPASSRSSAVIRWAIAEHEPNGDARFRNAAALIGHQ